MRWLPDTYRAKQKQSSKDPLAKYYTTLLENWTGLKSKLTHKPVPYNIWAKDPVNAATVKVPLQAARLKQNTTPNAKTDQNPTKELIEGDEEDEIEIEEDDEGDKDEWEDVGPALKIAARQKVIRDAFNSLPKTEKEKWEETTLRRQKQAIKEWKKVSKGKPSEDPRDRQK